MFYFWYLRSYCIYGHSWRAMWLGIGDGDGVFIMCHRYVAGTYPLSTMIESGIRRRNLMAEDGVFP